MLTTINGNALNDPKLKITNADAFLWLKQESANLKDHFDFIIV